MALVAERLLPLTKVYGVVPANIAAFVVVQPVAANLAPLFSVGC
jgi:hypothetical protein